MRYLFTLLGIALLHVVVASEPIALTTPTGTLYGELEVPENNSGVVVLIIAGSGPTDRDGNSKLINGKCNTLKLLAEGLVDKGVASLRYDKRGVGLSGKALSSETDLTFDVLINDAKLWIEQLKKDTRFNTIYILGHSQGGLIAAVLGQLEDVKGVVSIAGMFLDATSTLKTQLKSLPEGLNNEAMQILEQLKSGKEVGEVNMFLANIFRPSVQPFLRSWMQYSPKLEAQKMGNKKALIVHGETDIQIQAWHADSLSTSFENANLFKVSGMNHVLKDAPMSRNENMATYSDPDLPISAGVIDAISAFVLTD